MKNSKKTNSQLKINKFQISKISNLQNIVGGDLLNINPLKTIPTISK
jgi:hypothetical protein